MVLAEIPLWVSHSTTSNDDNGNDAEKNNNIKPLLIWDKKATTAKTAIYTIDVHPDYSQFATGGGDGTVRIWQTLALCKTQSKTGKYTAEGNYVSSSESNSSDGEKSVIEDDNNNNNTIKQPQTIHDLSTVVRRKGSSPKTSPLAKEAAGLKAADNSTKSSDRLLCTLSAHSGSSVLAIRYSNKGTYLASAGDDTCVCIYAKSSNSSIAAAAANSSNNNNSNNGLPMWMRIKVCRGHHLDVVGLAWAPNDAYLVSCSLDRETPIIVWKTNELAPNNSNNTVASSMVLHPYKILGRNEHTSTVKGVAFDPAGSYLASTGDDPAVCIWRAHHDDDWGLEARVDASSGLFRQWNANNATYSTTQSLFARLSWSTDGAFVCCPQSVVKNKHVCATLAREEWSTARPTTTATLVGHAQPIVVSRSMPHLLKMTKNYSSKSKKQADSDEDMSSVDSEVAEINADPEYAAMIALGDKRGFVTIWSTRQPRPIFKMQCSESKCTVTDMAWARQEDHVLLLVSLLDGQVVVLKFTVPDEIGELLTPAEQARVFQMRYGIDEVTEGQWLGGSTDGKSKFIENVLQMTLEGENNDMLPTTDETAEIKDDVRPVDLNSDVRNVQQETVSKGGKKRIIPVLMNVPVGPEKRAKPQEAENSVVKPVATAQTALDAANKALAANSSVATKQKQGPEGNIVAGNTDTHSAPASRPTAASSVTSAVAPLLPHDTSRIHTADLPFTKGTLSSSGALPIMECVNSLKVPSGSKNRPISCIDVKLNDGSNVVWRDQIYGTTCSAIAATSMFVAVGCIDGSVQIYSTSATVGWSCGLGVRALPPLILGQTVVKLQLKEVKDEDERSIVKMLVVTSDASFAVYTLFPVLSLDFKGSLFPAMMHMSLSLPENSQQRPALSNIQLADDGRIFLVLSFQHLRAQNSSIDAPRAVDSGAGGSLQAFLYNRQMELWMRVADSRFTISDFYNHLPIHKDVDAGNSLFKLEQSVRLGALDSSIRPTQRGRAVSHTAHDEAFLATRAHCEDRMACAIAFDSSDEFAYWLSKFISVLAGTSNEKTMRAVIDMILGSDRLDTQLPVPGQSFCWWASSAPTLLSSSRQDIIKNIVLREMSKNRNLQRLTQEISVLVDN